MDRNPVDKGLEWNKSTVSNFLGPFVLLLVQGAVQKKEMVQIKCS